MRFYNVYKINGLADFFVYGEKIDLDTFESWYNKQQTLDEIIEKCIELGLTIDADAIAMRNGNIDGRNISHHINSLAKIKGILITGR